MEKRAALTACVPSCEACVPPFSIIKHEVHPDHYPQGRNIADVQVVHFVLVTVQNYCKFLIISEATLSSVHEQDGGATLKKGHHYPHYPPLPTITPAKWTPLPPTTQY